MFTAALLLCMLAATSVVAQESLTIATVKPAPTFATATIINPTLRPTDFCPRPHLAVATATSEETEDEAVTDQLDRGEITVDEARARIRPIPIIRPIPRCENGPIRVIHTVPGEFHWPPIIKTTCNNLFCKDPPCLPRVQVQRRRCVLVFKLINGRWVNIGFRIRFYVDHLSCRCKDCRDIRNRQQCVNTYPCPNSNNTCGFCYWIPGIYTQLEEAAPTAATVSPDGAADDVIAPVPYPPPGRCACCTPTCCPAPKRFNYDRCRCECPPRSPCPAHQVFNENTCKCECPKGSKLIGGKCVGDCEDIIFSQCNKVHCTDNNHFRCKRVGYRCQCPSCDTAAESAWCVRTKCLEQPSKPKCVFDSDSNKCRCPQCSDMTGTDPIWCRKVYCGPNNNIQCKWEAAWKKCFCPGH